MSVDIVTGGSALPVPDPLALLSLAEAKAHCRIDFADEDALITSLIGVAVAIAESEVQRALLPRTYAWTRRTLGCDMRLPLAPVKQVRSVAYLPFPNGPLALTLDPQLYYVERRGAGMAIRRNFAAAYPFVGEGPSPVVVTFDAGDVALVPPNVKHALKMIVSDLLENPTPSVLYTGSYQMNRLGAGTRTTVQSLLEPERWQ